MAAVQSPTPAAVSPCRVQADLHPPSSSASLRPSVAGSIEKHTTKSTARAHVFVVVSGHTTNPSSLLALASWRPGLRGSTASFSHPVPQRILKFCRGTASFPTFVKSQPPCERSRRDGVDERPQPQARTGGGPGCAAHGVSSSPAVSIFLSFTCHSVSVGLPSHGDPIRICVGDL